MCKILHKSWSSSSSLVWLRRIVAFWTLHWWCWVVTNSSRCLLSSETCVYLFRCRLHTRLHDWIFCITVDHLRTTRLFWSVFLVALSCSSDQPVVVVVLPILPPTPSNVYKWATIPIGTCSADWWCRFLFVPSARCIWSWQMRISICNKKPYTHLHYSSLPSGNNTVDSWAGACLDAN